MENLRKVFTVLVFVFVLSALNCFAASETVSGMFQILWGDPPPKSNASAVEQFRVIDQSGEQSTRVHLDPDAKEKVGGVLFLNGKQIRATGTQDSSGFRIQDAAVLGSSSTKKTSMMVVNVLCNFSNTPAPHNNSWYQNIMGSAYSGMNSFWNQVSFKKIGFRSATVGWYKMPHQKSYYVQDNDGDGWLETYDHTRLVNDCMKVADADVDYPKYDIVNLWFGDSDDWVYSWGGQWDLRKDGQRKTYGVTQLASWADSYVLAHEIGHALGLPHSSGKFQDTYDSPWDVMSIGRFWDEKRHPFGSIGVHTIAFHKDMLGWIPAAEKYTAAGGSNAVIRISRLEVPAATGNYLMAQIPIGKSKTRFYTVEARRLHGYDAGLPAQAIIIHKVNTTLSDRLARVVGNYKRNELWTSDATFTPGKSYDDVKNGISVKVVSQTATYFRVQISVR